MTVVVLMPIVILLAAAVLHMYIGFVFPICTLYCVISFAIAVLIIMAICSCSFLFFYSQSNNSTSAGPIYLCRITENYCAVLQLQLNNGRVTC